MTNHLASAVLLGLAMAPLGCWSPEVLPPPAAPTKEMPPVRADFGPLAPGRQWVVLDTPDDVAHVTKEVEGLQTAYGNSIYKDVCVTPCVVDLKSGKQTLLFASTKDPFRAGSVRLQLGDDPLIVRHLMPESRPSSAAGGILIATGVLMGIIGGIMAPVTYAKGDQNGLPLVGLGVLGVGAVLTAIGIPLNYTGRGWSKPGATTWWTVPRGGTTPSSVEP
jgi:hypothetical protein